jgi:hypothetical protein
MPLIETACEAKLFDLIDIDHQLLTGAKEVPPR